MLEVKNISKSFALSENRDYCVLNKISFTLPDRGLFFLFGKSGSGKSTLLNILCGLIKPDEGEVLIDGTNIFKLKKSEFEKMLKDNIGIVFQKYNLIDDLTMKENLDIAASIKGNVDDDYVDELIDRYKLEGKLNQNVNTLSGGEKQRVSVIRALINDPKILLLDEPTGALDEENSLLLYRDLYEISNRCLVIMVTHNVNLLHEKCDGYIELRNGRIDLLEFNEDNKRKFDAVEKRKGKRKNDNKFISMITKKNIFKNIKLNMINLASSLFTMLFIILSFFFNEGIKNNKEKIFDTYIDKDTFEVSKTIKESIKDSPLSLVKSERPNNDEIEQLIINKDIVSSYDYSYFFNCEKILEIDGIKIKDFYLKPFYDISLKENEIVANQTFFDKYLTNNLAKNSEHSSALFIKKDIYSKTNNTYEIIKDTCSVEINFSLKYVKKEFFYLNQPTIFYNPFYVEKILKSTHATNLSQKEEKDISYYDLVERSGGNEEITNYKILLFSLNEKERNYLLTLKNGLLEITNNSFIIIDSFSTLAKTVFLGLDFFVIITLLTSLFVSSFLAYFSSIRNEKESAILATLGARESQIKKIYINEQLFFAFIGSLMGVLTSILFSKGINEILKGYFLYDVINIDWKIVFLFVVFFVVFSFICISIPTIKIKKNNLYEELKEE